MKKSAHDPFVDPTVEELLALQAGVLSRRQLAPLGLADHDIARMLRPEDLGDGAPRGLGEPHGRGHVASTRLGGRPVLVAGGPQPRLGAACLRWTGREIGGSDHARHGGTQPTVGRPSGSAGASPSRVRRARAVEPRTARVRYEQAALDVAARAASEFDAVAVLAKVVSSRRTTAARVLLAAAERQRLPRRDWICAVLRDISEGTCSVLEHAYLNRVERPHGLPRARRQSAGAGRVGRIYRDAAYIEHVSSSSTAGSSMTRRGHAIVTSTATSSRWWEER